MNPADLIVIVIIAVIVLLAIRRIRINRSSSGCSCGCSGCSRPCAMRATDNCCCQGKGKTE